MSGPGNAFVDLVMEILAPLGDVRSRRMFGGHGIFMDGLMFALVADDTLYLKVDDHNRPAFGNAGLPAFGYTARGKTMQLSYHEAPAEGFDDPDLMVAWAKEAFAAALRTDSSRKKPKHKPPST